MKKDTKYFTISELRSTIFSCLPLNRLQTIAKCLGVFNIEELNRTELIGKLQRSRAYSTDMAFHFMTLRELRALAKLLRLPLRSRAKAGLIAGLTEDTAIHRTAPSKLPRKTRQLPVATSLAPSLEQKSLSEIPPLSEPERETASALDSKVWVQCPKCASPVKKVNIERHLNSVHSDGRHDRARGKNTPKKSTNPLGLTKQEILEAIGYEWCVDFMRGRLTHAAAEGMSDIQIVNAFLGKKGRNLQSLIRELTDHECLELAAYLEIKLPPFGGPLHQQLTSELRSAANDECRRLLGTPKPQTRLSKKKRRVKAKKTQQSREAPSGPSMDIFNRGLVVNGGAYGLGKNRRH